MSAHLQLKPWKHSEGLMGLTVRIWGQVQEHQEPSGKGKLVGQRSDSYVSLLERERRKKGARGKLLAHHTELAH